MNTKFVHDVGAVCFNGPDGDSQQRSYLFIRLPIIQVTDNFNFARSKRDTCPACLSMLALGIEKYLENDVGYLWREETIALKNGFHCFWEAVCEIGF